MTSEHFLHLTELAGTEISEEQLQRMVNRYVWAAEYCAGKDVLEVACGSGAGLKMLSRRARSIHAGDYSEEVLEHTRKALGNSVDLRVFDAQDIPFPDQSFDVILIFEALYYIPDASRFFAEAKRLLRPGGYLLIATANKDLFDFNPSPFSHAYLGAVELARNLGALGFEITQWGDTPISTVPLRQRVLRPIKALAVKLGLMPKTSESKLWLKRFVFGRMAQMPRDIDETTRPYIAPRTIANDQPDRVHKVIFCAAGLPSAIAN